MLQDTLMLDPVATSELGEAGQSTIARVLDRAGVELREGTMVGHVIVATGTAAILGLGIWAWTKNKKKSDKTK